MIRHGLVLGNSHAACMREAWKACGSDSIRLEFVAAHAEKMDGLAFEGDLAVARTDDLRTTLERLGMRRSFRLDEFDFFVVTACQLSIFRAVEAARAMAVWPEAQGERHLVSGPCFREALADSLRSTSAARLVRGVSRADVPVLVLPQPHPNESILKPEGKFAGFRRIDGAGRGAWLGGMFRAACESAMAGLAQVLHQPAPTCGGSICTAAVYSTGSVMLAPARREHQVDDVLHANAAYGALQLEQIVAGLAARA